MKIYFLIGFFLVNCFLLLSQEQQFIWDSKKRIERTHSSKIDEQKSFHVVSYKDAKSSTYGLVLFVTDKTGISRKFESSSFEKLPSILSYRFDTDTQNLILIVAYESHNYRNLERINFDWNSGKQVYRANFGTLNKNGVVVDYAEGIAVVQKKDSLLHLRTIKTNEAIDSIAVAIKHISIVDLIFQNGIQWVDQKEYVAHGSVYPSKVYEDQGKLYFVLQREKNFKVIVLDLNNPDNQIFSELSVPEIKKFQDTYSYIFKGKLVVFYHNVNDIAIEIFDVLKREKLHSYSLAQDFKYQINRREIAPLMNKFKEPKHHLTAAINEGLNGELVINFDYVDVNGYKYGKDPFFNEYFFRTFFMQMQQQNMMNQQFLLNTNLNRGGGGGPNLELLEMASSGSGIAKKEEPVRFSVVLQPDLSIADKPIRKTRYKNAENHPDFIAIKSNKKLKHSTATAVGQECRYLFYNKKERAFKVRISAFTD